ncbi:site-specific integrase [Pseudomonas coronafaciens]|uniref:hypothetical protein n=1 Tax=Pseudomonas coronafaciens TaxID=53409 RepID=UPI001424AE12|nr:hypothetical protein [Pseudomonas coronafaciens]QIQ72013.1 hypothetical protein HBB04_02404 [Pseudomonas coronafaciens]
MPATAIIDDEGEFYLERYVAVHGKPSWLMSDIKSATWRLKEIGNKRSANINFDFSVSLNTTLKDYPYLYETVRRVVFHIREGEFKRFQSASAVVLVANSYFTLCRWMIAKYIYRFSELTAEDYEEFKASVVYGQGHLLEFSTIVQVQLGNLFDELKILPSDSSQQRASKAMGVVPVRAGTNFIDVRKLLLMLGFGWMRKNAEVGFEINEFAESIGFGRDPALDLAYSDCDEDKIVTTENLRRYLNLWEYLFNLRRVLHDTICFNPFAVTSPGIQAQRLGGEIGRTGTLPFEQAAHVLERSARWVLNYGRPLIHLSRHFNTSKKAFELFRGLKNHTDFTTNVNQLRGPDGPLGLFCEQGKQYFSFSRSKMRLALNYLRVACAIIIAAFCARRASEVVGLKENCCERDMWGKLWVTFFIHKSDLEERKIPAPEIVLKAVSLLCELSAESRFKTGSEYIFVSDDLDGNVVGLSVDGYPCFVLGAYLARFGAYLNIPKLADGSIWVLRPHQFRRFFAILYVWIYELGDLAALSNHLRHGDLEKTRRYVTEPKMGSIIRAADKAHTIKLLTDAAYGKISLTGTLGDRLTKLSEKIYQQLLNSTEVYSERRLWQKLSKLVERTGMSLRASPWAFCAFMDSDTHMHRPCGANVDRSRVSNATLSACKACKFHVGSDVFTPFLTTHLETHQKIIASDAPPLIKNLSVKAAEECRNLIDQNKLKR